LLGSVPLKIHFHLSIREIYFDQFGEVVIKL
jgi:hypothetical protein